MGSIKGSCRASGFVDAVIQPSATRQRICEDLALLEGKRHERAWRGVLRLCGAMSAASFLLAADAFREVIKMTPNSPDAYYNLGRLYNVGRPDEAPVAYAHAVALAADPTCLGPGG